MSRRAEARQELAWRKAKRDILWCSTHWWIQHPQGNRKWDLYDAQRSILTVWDSGENVIHLKARQLGFSTSVGFYAWKRAFFEDGKKILLISRGERESMELLDKVKFGLRRLPDWMKDRGPTIDNETQTKIVFSNGSEIISLPSGSDPARGFTGALVVVDEWAFMEDSEKAWASIEPVADIGGQIIGLSTANGTDNMFFELWEKAEAGIGMFKPMFFPWSAVPNRDQAWYESKVESMLEWQLHQEYPTASDEAFIKSGATVFDVGALMDREPWDGKRYRLNGAGTDTPRLDPSPRGEIEVWEDPNETSRYVLGVDVAEGLGHGDFSSMHVIDARTNGVVATWHGHMPADLLADQVYGLGLLYNTALVVPEINNHGLTTVTVLRQRGYKKIYRSRERNKTTAKVSIEFGFRTTRWNKAPLIDGLGTWLRDNHDLPCKDTIRELTKYVRNDRGAMGGSPHDDRVMSLAMATHGLDYVMLPEYTEEIDDYMTSAWWLRQCEPDREVSAMRPLGLTRGQLT